MFNPLTYHSEDDPPTILVIGSRAHRDLHEVETTLTVATMMLDSPRPVQIRAHASRAGVGASLHTLARQRDITLRSHDIQPCPPGACPKTVHPPTATTCPLAKRRADDQLLQVRNDIAIEFPLNRHRSNIKLSRLTKRIVASGIPLLTVAHGRIEAHNDPAHQLLAPYTDTTIASNDLTERLLS